MKTLIYIPPVISFIVLLCSSFLISACYTLKQGTSMISYLNSGVPLESLLEGESEDVNFVNKIDDIKHFAIENLGLKPTKNYTNYVKIDRDYLAAIVSASKKDAFVNYQWWFPVVGKVPYKGFFNIDDAKKEAAKLQNKDLDTLIRPVDAFSTLGWFKDPLYSFMKNYSAASLADLIIHESFHATVFLKNNVQFNEELAEFVGSTGARIYIEQKYGINSNEYNEMIWRKIDSKTYIAYIQKLILELDELYKSDLDREEKLQKKEEIIASAQQTFLKDYDAMFKSDNYRFAGSAKINNAYLALYRLYYERSSTLQNLFDKSGGNLKNFILLTKQLNNKSDPLTQLENLILNGAQ